MSHSNRRIEPGPHSEPEPADLMHVSLDDPRELAYWMDYFGTSANRLHEAVSLMGTEMPRVRAYLRSFR